MRLIKQINLIISAVVLLLPVTALANPVNSDTNSANYNMLLISLVGLMLILLFVIGMLANVLRQLSFVIIDKIRKDKKDAGTIVKTILLLIFFCIPALHALAEGTTSTAVAAASNYISGIPEDDFYSIMIIIILELTVIFALAAYIKILLLVISKKPEIVPVAKAIVRKSWFWDNFNKAVPIEKEKDLLLDHNYDGIQELDNSLPPWWKYGFYVTIVVAVIYLYRFHVSHDGLSQKEEYLVEMQKGEEEKAAYLAQSANNVDESSVTLLTDPNEIAAGREIFVKTCAPCHLPDGGGNVGPNLTDEYWLHGGGIKDIFKSIKYGWQDKGMKSWKDDFSPKQIQDLASFVKSLKGTHPATPKAPQGDLYIEAATGANKEDTIKTKNATQNKVAIIQ